MNTWLPHPINLTGQLVQLVPLKREHLPALQQAAGDKRIWEFYPMDCSVPERFNTVYEEAMDLKQKGAQYPFAIINRSTNNIIGSTRYLDISAEDRRLEIGWTWLRPAYWRTAFNPECKLLLLTYAFETLKAIRVQLKTDETNARSRKAIEKIGGKLEGIHRHDRIRDNGTYRSSAYYSLLDEEWPTVKSNLLKMVEEKSA